MAFCRNCGAQIHDEAVICPNCGVPSKPKPADNGGFGWWMLGCCVPVVGLILWLVWKGEKPVTAKAVGTGALVSVIVYIVLYVIGIVGGIAASML